MAHALGALLLEQGLDVEAQAVYRRDLERWPDNLWSLHGLLAALGGPVESGDTDTRAPERRALQGRLEVSSSRADEKPRHSCLCAGMAPPRAGEAKAVRG